MVIRGAMAFRFRSMSAARTMVPVRKVALRGSPRRSWEARLALAGTILFDAIACRMRGAPTIEPSEEERVAPRSPARTAGGKADCVTITSYSLTSCYGVAERASQYARTT